MSDNHYVLEPRDDRPAKGERGEDPWAPWYDKTFGLVIRAPDEATARDRANDVAKGMAPVWDDPELVHCTPIEEYDEQEYLIMENFARA